MQNRVELSRDLFWLFKKKCDASITQVDDLGRLLTEVGQDRVSLGASEGNAFPFALIRMGLRAWSGARGRTCGGDSR